MNSKKSLGIGQEKRKIKYGELERNEGKMAVDYLKLSHGVSEYNQEQVYSIGVLARYITPLSPAYKVAQ
jgi:hypothetical protein